MSGSVVTDDLKRVAIDMSGQANYEADPQAPVQGSLLVHRPPHLGQVLAYPGQDGLSSGS
jgi:hypothetical protein